jgi:hypothetical protein
MKIRVGDELFVNSKWYWDVVSIQGKTLGLQMPYSEGDNNYLSKVVQVPSGIIKVISGTEGMYNAEINEGELKKLLGPFIAKLVLQPDVYSIIGVTHMKESFSGDLLEDEDDDYSGMDTSKFSESQHKLLKRIEKIKYDSIEFDEWEEYALSLGVTTYELVEHIMGIQNTDDDLNESAFFLKNEFDYLDICTSFSRFSEEGVAMATASLGGDSSTPSVPGSPGEPGVPGEAGKDMTGPGWVGVYMKKAASYEKKNKIKKKKKISETTGDVAYGLAKLIDKSNK